jgi:hypothetical protein
MKKVMTILSIMIVLGIYPLSINAQTNKISNQSFAYSLCQAEYGKCPNKCSVKLIMGDKIAIESYIKVYAGDELITEGYILEHMSGSIFILKDKKEALDPDVCGGCCGGAYEININKKQIWGC